MSAGPAAGSDVTPLPSDSTASAASSGLLQVRVSLSSWSLMAVFLWPGLSGPRVQAKCTVGPKMPYLGV